MEVSPPPPKNRNPPPPPLDRYGASSFTLMESGTPHSGWKTMVRMLAEKTAVGVSALPTTILRRMDDLALLEDARHELRQVVLDVELAQVLRHPAPALHVDDQALRLRAGRGGAAEPVRS